MDCEVSDLLASRTGCVTLHSLAGMRPLLLEHGSLTGATGTPALQALVPHINRKHRWSSGSWQRRS
jgi:hypothetical protein